MRKVIYIFIALSFLATAFSANVFAQRGALKVIKTMIPVHYKGGLAVGDSVIAYGTGINTGVDYIKAGDTKSRGIPGAERFRSTGFAVAGDKIVLIDNSEFSYHIFDAATGKMSDIPNLKNRGASLLRSSGNYVLAVVHNRQTNKEGVAIIDLSGTAPVVNVYPLWKGAYNVNQAAFDASSGWLAITDGYEKVAAIMFKSGDAEPILHDVTDTNGISNELMAVGGDTLYYFDRKSGVHSVYELNLRTGAKKALAVNPAIFLAATGGGTTAYFARRDAKDMNGTEARLVVMRKGSAPAILVPTDKFVDGATKNNGLMGFGNRIAITPDGKYVFISGQDTIGRTEVLQYYDGTGVKLVSDSASATKPTALLGSDVVANGSFAAFKIGANNDTNLAYIKLK